MNDNTHLRTNAVARRYHVTADCVRKWIKAGLLPSEKFGRDYGILATALLDFKPPKRGRPKKGAKV